MYSCFDHGYHVLAIKTVCKNQISRIKIGQQVKCAVSNLVSRLLGVKASHSGIYKPWSMISSSKAVFGFAQTLLEVVFVFFAQMLS